MPACPTTNQPHSHTSPPPLHPCTPMPQPPHSIPRHPLEPTTMPASPHPWHLPPPAQICLQASLIPQQVQRGGEPLPKATLSPRRRDPDPWGSGGFLRAPDVVGVRPKVGGEEIGAPRGACGGRRTKNPTAPPSRQSIDLWPGCRRQISPAWPCPWIPAQDKERTGPRPALGP